MEELYGYIPQEKRRKILLICDDIRTYSGVATVAKEIVIKTSNHFNWVQIAGAIQHPEKGKRLDLSEANNSATGLKDSYIIQYPVDGYGSPDILRQIIDFEKPDAIMLFTDPRYFVWVFNMEKELRKKLPIIYLNIWDDLPAPYYNAPYYEACDLLLGISKQTVNINKMVLENVESKPLFKYLPHGLDHNIFHPIEDDKLNEFKDTIFKGKEVDFVMFFNSRNIRRKQIPDTILAFKLFLEKIEREGKDPNKCFMIMHTELISEAGTDLDKVRKTILGKKYKNNLIFSNSKLSQEQLNMLYNIADVQILLTSNEGWGLSLTEAILAGTPIIANVTGGMQDQMRFSIDGKWIEFNPDFPSNHRGTIKTHGKWAFPVFPSNISLQGSVPTPYIYDDRCSFEDASEQMYLTYTLGRKELKKRGKIGREWAISEEAGFTSNTQGKRFIKYTEELFKNWKPKLDYELINCNLYESPELKNKLIY